MATHELRISVPAADVSRVDVEFEVWEDGEKLGTLLVSKGDIRWAPRKSPRSKARRRTWAQLDEWMRARD